MTKLHDLARIGQAIWLDYMRRSLIQTGELQDLIDKGLRGMTSNPKIFDQTISGGGAYDDQIRELARAGKSAQEIYEAVAIKDIQDAADLMRPVYETTEGLDGYISLEANPHLAYETEATIDEIHRLHEQVNRPNVMFKVPATPVGIPAVEQLISEGININITLMFSMDHYEKVANAYIAGLEKLSASGGDVSTVASVASFFLSRVDVKVDARLEERDLQGRAAIANAKAVYARFQEIFSGDRWQKLADQGARVQRPLWASTSTKDPDYPDTMYVDNLIGPHTVNTVPPQTLDAFLDHGTVAETVEEGLDDVYAHLRRLEERGIDMNEVGEELQREGVDKFVKPFDELLATIDKARARLPQT